MESFLPDVLAVFLSLTAVAITLLRARASETEASARAVHEVVDNASDLRSRLNQLEHQHRRKDEQLQQLRQQVSNMPRLEARIEQLTEKIEALNAEASARKAYHEGEMQSLRDRGMEREHQFNEELAAKQGEIDALSTRLTQVFDRTVKEEEMSND